MNLLVFIYLLWFIFSSERLVLKRENTYPGDCADNTCKNFNGFMWDANWRHSKFHCRAWMWCWTFPDHSFRPTLPCPHTSLAMTCVLIVFSKERIFLLQMQKNWQKYQLNENIWFIVSYWLCVLLIEPCHEKTCLCHMQTTKAQISLRICTVW